MKNRLIPLLAACLLLTGCSGLPAAREMGDMALLRTVGVDAAPAGVTVTGSTGPRAKGLQGEEEQSLVLAAERESLSGACLAMQGQSDSYVFFGYVDQLLLGEELAKQGIQPVLDYFARDVELGLGAQLWLVREATAQEAVASGGEEGIDRRLETLQTDSKMGIAALTRTAGEVCTDLLELGSAYVPALSPSGEKDGVLTESGYGVLKNGALAGYLEGEEAKGLELLAGGTVADMLEMALPDGPASIKITSACTKSKLEFQGDAPSKLRLICRVEGRMVEYQKPPDSQVLEQLQEAVAVREQARLRAALDRLQGWQTDCVGLGVRAAMGHPGKWQAVEEDWPQWFARIPVEVRVEIVLNG